MLTVQIGCIRTTCHQAESSVSTSQNSIYAYRKSNLVAYNLAGIATRLAFSIGLNIGSNYGSPAFDAEEARRTWWMIYVQEVELSLDSGRPMSIRTCEMDIGYPSSQVCPAGT